MYKSRLVWQLTKLIDTCTVFSIISNSLRFDVALLDGNDMDAEILNRIQRLTAAFGKVRRTDLKNFPARIYQNSASRLMIQDFSGGASEADLENVLDSMISNLGKFLEYLQTWGERHGVSRYAIQNYLLQSFDFRVIMDLNNREKHAGRQPRDRKGLSGRAPTLGRPRSVLQVKTGPKNNSCVTVIAGPHGEPVSTGDGSSEVIVTAEVLDRNSNGMGDVDKYIRGALRFCESALRDFGVKHY